jgi:hypothetical protein
MEGNKLKFLMIGISALVVINLLVLDFIWVSQQRESSIPIVSLPEKLEFRTGATITPTPTPASLTPVVSSPEESGGCLESCQEYIDQKIAEELAKLPTPVTTTETVIQTIQPTPSSKVTYISLGGSSSTSATGWTDIPGSDFYFDLSDYPTATGVRWEISLRSFLAGNMVYARLYDVTNSRAVDFSELTSTSGTSELKRSVDLAIWRGNNLYRIQGKSSTGTPAYLDSPRLKITLE